MKTILFVVIMISYVIAIFAFFDIYKDTFDQDKDL